MLADFQQALADMVSSPELCAAIRTVPGNLKENYDLTELEFQRLVGMVNHPGMTCNCILYRANRLAPLALNLRELSRELGSGFRALLEEFWRLYPNTDVNFLVESDRFCQFLMFKQEQGYILTEAAKQAFEREYTDLELRLIASQTVL